MVNDGQNGLLCDTDDIEAIATAMEKALQLKDLEMTYQPGDKKDFLALFQ
jgi:glycosyltransferase involved in cell wall biosynthesis